MKCKVIELIDTLNDGGAETLVKDYALMINKDEFDVFVVVVRKTPETANYQILLKSGIPIISLYKSWNIFAKIFDKVVGEKYKRYRLRKIIEDIEPDVIHAHLLIIKVLADICDSL